MKNSYKNHTQILQDLINEDYISPEQENFDKIAISLESLSAGKDIPIARSVFKFFNKASAHFLFTYNPITQEIESQVEAKSTDEAKKISYKSDAIHFAEIPNGHSMQNYLAGNAILVKRLNKQKEMKDFFIQAIPDDFDRTKIKHLKVHPKQNYLMVSNDYINAKPNSSSYRIGGELVDEYTFYLIKNGSKIWVKNPSFFRKKDEGLESLQKFGSYLFEIDLFQSRYQKYTPIRPTLNEYFVNNVIEFAQNMKQIAELQSGEEIENRIGKLLTNAANAKENEVDYIATHINYYINTTNFLLPDQKDKRWHYCFIDGINMEIEKEKKDLIIYPVENPKFSKLINETIKKATYINLTDPVELSSKILFSTAKTKEEKALAESILEEVKNSFNNTTSLKIS